MPSPTDQLKASCGSCTTTFDVSNAAPYSLATCPSCGTPSMVRSMFNQFRIEREVGVGGMSRVFAATDITLDRQVALKILNADFSSDKVRLAQFEREARLTASFSHPHIVKVFSVGKDQDHFYIAMELVPGGSLDDKIRLSGAQAEAAILEMAIEVTQGLRTAHAQGLIHRDLKPGNILFAEDGTAKIVDFGLALIQGKDVDESTEIWATPFYVPPEKLEGVQDTFRGDMYSLGATLFHALAGRPPHARESTSIEELRRIKAVPVRLRAMAPQVSEETAAIVDRLMSRRPERRYDSYDQLLEHLDFARKKLQQRPVRTEPLPWWQQHLASLIGTAAVLVAGLIVAKVIVGDTSKEKTTSTLPPVTDASTPTTGRGAASLFMEARQQMLAGKFSEARPVFQGIGAGASTASPTRQWAIFHEALCAALLGDAVGARTAFNALAKLPDWAQTPDEKETSGLFAEASALLSDPSPLPPDAGGRFAAGSPRGIVLLPLALRYWEDGRIDAAADCFRQFSTANPPASSVWTTDYRRLGEPYLSDIAAAGSFPSLERPTSSGEARAVVATAEKVLASLKSAHGLKPQLTARLDAFRREIAGLEEKERTMAAEAETARSKEELLRVSDAIAQARSVRSGYRFQAGADILKGVTVTGAAAQTRRDDAMALWQGAEDFLKTLADDLNAAGWKGPIDRLGNPGLNGQISRASRDRWAIRSTAAPGGAAAAPDQIIEVTSVTPQCLVSLGEQMAERTADSDQYYRRRELLVLFAKVCDLDDYAKMAGESLTRELKPFRERWPRLAAVSRP